MYLGATDDYCGGESDTDDIVYLDQESANSEIVFGGVNQKALRGMPYMWRYPADRNDDMRTTV
jgi:hypothetical protein